MPLPLKLCNAVPKPKCSEASKRMGRKENVMTIGINARQRLHLSQAYVKLGPRR